MEDPHEADEIGSARPGETSPDNGDDVDVVSLIENRMIASNVSSDTLPWGTMSSYLPPPVVRRRSRDTRCCLRGGECVGESSELILSRIFFSDSTRDSACNVLDQC